MFATEDEPTKGPWRRWTLGYPNIWFKGTAEDPAQVKVINTLENDDVLDTGLDDNASIWLGIVICAGAAIAALWWRRRNTRV